jgi:hypothetical protein
MSIKSAVAIALAFACNAAAAAPLDFSGPTALAAEDGVVDSAALADFDGDGDNDIAWASSANGRVSFLSNSGGAGVRATLLQIASVKHVATADVDLDGRADLVTATTGGSLVFHRNTGVVTGGVPQFESHPAFATGATLIAKMALADMNRDGRADLVLGRISSPLLQVHFFTQGSAGRFSAAAAVPAPANALRIRDLALADFDNDGQRDIVATASFESASAQTGGQVFLVPRSTGGGFAAALTIDAGTESPFLHPGFAFDAIVAWHSDVQNGVDVAYAINDGAESRLVVLHNDGTRIAAPPIVVDQGSSPYRALAARDLDRDGDDDLVFVSGAGETGWLENNFAIGLPPTRHLLDAPLAGRAIALFTDDADLDGDFDLRFLQDAGGLFGHRNVTLHGNPFLAGNERFISIPAPTGPFEVVTRQLDRGPRREGVVAEFNAGTVRTLTSTRFSFSKLNTGLRNPPVMSDVGAARELSVGDFDHDGDDDFMLATGESGNAPPANQNRLHTSLNGSPPLNATLACTANDIRGLAAGDLREPSFAAVYAAEDADKVAVFSACPQETLISTVANGIPNGPNSAKLGDLDQDGDLDLVIAARQPSTAELAGDLLGWYPNLGAANFGPLVRIATIVGARDATLADVDRDGKLDVVAGSTEAGIQLFRNLGGAVFATPVVAADIVGPNRVEAADLDHDGDIDLVVPSASETGRGPFAAQCGLSVLLADGDGGFAAPICVSDPVVGSIPWTRAAVDDIDGNGMPDIVATAFSDGIVMLYSPNAPEHFSIVDGADAAASVLDSGVEQCVSHADLFHLGRAGDSDLQPAQVTANALGTQGTGFVDALVLRADDGDSIAETNADAVIAVADDTTLVDGNVTWTFTPTHRQPVGDGFRRYWLCVRPLPALLPNNQVLQLSALQFPAVRNADTGTAANGRVRDGDIRVSVRSAPIFRDGLEAFN